MTRTPKKSRGLGRGLSALMSEQKIRLSDENLSTLLCEVEAIINSRPITEISSDPNDLEALTPNHILLLHSGVTFPPGVFKEQDCYYKRRWRQVQYLSDLFWTRWRRQYIVLLQQRQKWQSEERQHTPGDLVLVIDSQLPRSQWLLGRIVDVVKDKLGYVRTARVRVSKCKNSSMSEFNTSVILRPITKLILLRTSDT